MLEDSSSSLLRLSRCSEVQSIDRLPTASGEISAQEFNPGTYS